MAAVPNQLYIFKTPLLFSLLKFLLKKLLIFLTKIRVFEHLRVTNVPVLTMTTKLNYVQDVVYKQKLREKRQTLYCIEASDCIIVYG